MRAVRRRGWTRAFAVAAGAVLLTSAFSGSPLLAGAAAWRRTAPSPALWRTTQSPAWRRTAPSPAWRRTRRAASWLALSDVHFDPFEGATTATVDTLAATPPAQWGRVLSKVSKAPADYGSETNYALLASTLASMRRNVPHPPVVVVSGDFIGHNFREEYDQLASDRSQRAFVAFVDRTVGFLAAEFGRAFPHAQFVVTAGNNDSACGDYETTPNGPFLRGFARSWGKLVNRNHRAPAFTATFPRLGAYQARLPFDGGRAVVVNSVYWSPNYRNRCGRPAQNPAAAQLRWLARVARRLPRDGRAWLVTHIPVGVDVFGSQGKPRPVTLLWPGDQAPLLRILGNGAWGLDVTGHLHMSTFRLYPRGRVPIMVVPSITPVFRNNPAYYKLLVTSTGRVADYTAFRLGLKSRRPAWAREYSFARAYHAHGFNAASLLSLQSRLIRDPALRARYIRFYNSGSGIGGVTPATFRSYWCGDVALTGPAYSACLRARADRPPARAGAPARTG